MAAHELSTLTGPISGNYHCHQGADGAAYRDHRGGSLVICRSSRQDHDDALPETHAALG
jgi:hypothetical protein